MEMSITSEEKRENVKKDYDIIANDYALEFGKKYEDIDVINEFLSNLAPDSKILDLGGGVGQLTHLFIKRKYQAICYDFSKEMMRKAQEYYPGLPYILDDMLNLKKHFANQTFDGIVAFYSLFHVPKENISDVFSDINNLLKNDGIFCFVVQLGSGEALVDEPYLKEKGKEILYFNFFTKAEINSLLEENGFVKIFVQEKTDIGENELGNDENTKIFVIAKKVSPIQ